MKALASNLGSNLHPRNKVDSILPALVSGINAAASDEAALLSTGAGHNSPVGLAC